MTTIDATLAAGLGVVASCLSVTAFVPQVLQAWRSRSTKDVSFGMFALITAASVAWIIYGWLREDIPVLATNAVILGLALIMLRLKARWG